jgi:hypothetical protein
VLYADREPTRTVMSEGIVMQLSGYSLDRLRDDGEFILSSELDSAWAVRPLDLSERDAQLGRARVRPYGW